MTTTTTDYQGIALIIGSTAGLITVIGGTVIQIATFIRAGKQLELTKETHVLVDGQSEIIAAQNAKLTAALEAKAGLVGEQKGAQDERDRHGV